MRVLHVHSGNIYGGVETIMVTLAREWELCPSMEPHFALCFEARLSNELAALGVSSFGLGRVRISRPISVMRSRRALLHLLTQEHFDVVLCHSSWSQAIFGPVVRATGSPLVFWLHGAANGTHWIERWARRCRPEFVLCNSRFTQSTLPNLYPDVRSEVLYCPIALPEPTLAQSHRARVRAERDTAQDATVIIQVSRMEPGKGHRLHLEALGALRNLPGWVCWQVGGGERSCEVKYLEELKALAVKLKIADRVRFVGERADVGKLMGAADIYCQPNMGPDGFGITFIEALSAGLPIVTTELGAAKEIVDASCGVVVPAHNVQTLAETLRCLVEDPRLRSRLGDSGPIRAQALCNPARQITKLYELLATTNNGYFETSYPTSHIA